MKNSFSERVPFEIVIGLEVHAQLNTATKIFCSCKNEFGSAPNTNICPVCLGYPGTLPVLNRTALSSIIAMGLAVNCRINGNSRFARKNYFYPDLPKGYQTSQFDFPVCEDGNITVFGEKNEVREVRIKRIHLEEDAGKLIHDRGNYSLLDANRCGSPLIEIVTEPDMRSPQEAADYVNRIRELVRYLEICDGNMEEGSLRCDANVSLRRMGETELGVKTEIKNMNSIRNLEKALETEILRQAEILTDGGTIIQQTLLWNADKGETIAMRTKEDAHDYRYFPCPDLVLLDITDEFISEIKSNLPELPEAKRLRFEKHYAIPAYDAGVLVQDKELAGYFEAVCTHINDYKLASNWVMGEILRILNEEKKTVSEFSVTPDRLGELLKLVEAGTINGKVAKEIFPRIVSGTETASEIVEKENLGQISDENILAVLIDSVLLSNKEQVEEYRTGKEKVFGFFVGKLMKETKGRANPVLLNELLLKKLKNS